MVDVAKLAELSEPAEEGPELGRVTAALPGSEHEVKPTQEQLVCFFGQFPRLVSRVLRLVAQDLTFRSQGSGEVAHVAPSSDERFLLRIRQFQGQPVHWIPARTLAAKE
jgi:hypothetical protein